MVLGAGGGCTPEAGETGPCERKNTACHNSCYKSDMGEVCHGCCDDNFGSCRAMQAIVSIPARTRNSVIGPMRFPYVNVILALALVPACESTSSKPSNRRNDAGQIVVRAECKRPSMNCYNGCFRREEHRYCPSCCSDQLVLCDEGHPYNFDSCNTAESNPTPLQPPSPK